MSETDNSIWHLTDKQYDIVKFLVTIFLPAIGTLYFALGKIWGLPAGEQILGTIVAITAFLGAILGISSVRYENSGAKYSGAINVTETPDKKVFSLDLHDHPDDLVDKDEVTLKVNKPS